MNFVTFIENRYQELTLLNGQKYDVMKDAETKALHQIISSYRTVLKWLFIPKCLVHFLGVKLGKIDAPEPVLLEKLRKQKEEEEKKKASSHLELVEEPKKET